MQPSTAELVKATITHLESLVSVVVDWNPERYALSRQSRFAAAAGVGSARDVLQSASGGEERFSTELFLDATRRPAGERDLRALVETLERWMDPVPGTGLPSRVAFLWGAFRFRGFIESLEQVWVRFDPDGTPVRGHLRLTMRR